MPPGRSPRRHPDGVLIAVEGCDGSGKSTHAALLLRHLRRVGERAHLTRWNSSPTVHPIISRGKKSQRLFGTSYSLVHAADLADRYEREILPRLFLGQVVVSDRYVGTALARDGARGVGAAWIENLYSFARPADVTFLFRGPVELFASRISSHRGAMNHYETGGDLHLAEDPIEGFLFFQKRVADIYDDLAPRLGWVVIDATLPLRDQQRQVREEVARVLAGRQEVPS